MKVGNMTVRVAAGVCCVLAALGIVGTICAGERKDMSTKNSETTVTTNENGSVSRRFIESTVTTNGNMVTEHRRETRTTMDSDGKVLVNATSEYSQSYSIDESGRVARSADDCANVADSAVDTAAESFMGLMFGEEFEAQNFVQDSAEPALVRATFDPKKPLADFDDYYVYVTPKTHRIVKVMACARNAIDPCAQWKRHYLIEALEKRYGTWARLASFTRPMYIFDIGGGRFVKVCLAKALPDYETALVAWDEAMLGEAANEYEELRMEARKAAVEKRAQRVNDASAAF